jgi:formylglycine-generating enzyme required for sulfatase activity
MPQVLQQRQTRTFRHFIEPLNNDLGKALGIDMVLIPGGTFLMGSPANELKRQENEGPQHRVTLPRFFMGRYPVTQAQWAFVANLPQQETELDPDLSNFEGEKLPVETVTWYEAVEFCDRLSTYTGREYRLPTEAEWEYACRAGSTTPFHFGQTITTDVANYDGNFTYGDSPKGDYRQKTTPVGFFNSANAFGLSDMHGNVWEWCLDHWHDNYEGAPTDGSAWIEGGDSDFRVLRGGSWVNDPRLCRSASRVNINPAYRGDLNSYGFRVLCVAPRT